MKTTANISRIDIITVIAVIILFAMMMPSNAAIGKNANAGLSEIQAASSQLALFNNEIEKTVEYTWIQLGNRMGYAVSALFIRAILFTRVIRPSGLYGDIDLDRSSLRTRSGTAFKSGTSDQEERGDEEHPGNRGIPFRDLRVGEPYKDH